MGKEKRITDDVKATVNLWIDQIQNLATIATGRYMEIKKIGETYGWINASLEHAAKLIHILDEQGQETASLSRRLDQTKEMLENFSLEGYVQIDENAEWIDPDGQK